MSPTVLAAEGKTKIGSDDQSIEHRGQLDINLR